MRPSQSSMIVRHILHTLVILAMLFSLFGLRLDRAAAADPPNVWVFLGYSNGVEWTDIHGYNWPLDTLVTMTYLDLTTPATYIRTATVTDYGSGDIEVIFNTDGITPHAGDVVTLTAGATTVTTTVTALRLANVDPWLDRVSGTSNPGSSVFLGFDGGPNGRWITVAGDGTWLADFKVSGPDPKEVIYDFKPGQHLMIQQANGGGATGVAVYVPSYTLQVNRKGDDVHAQDWLGGWSQATLTIDNDMNPDNGVLYSQTRVIDANSGCGSICDNPDDIFDLQGLFTLAVGQYVTLKEGTIKKTVHISALHIDDVKVVNETLSGEADAGSKLKVTISTQGGNERSVAAVPLNGTWSVDFKLAGGAGNPATDIRPTDYGYAIQLNPDGSQDGTLEYWNLPRLIVQADHDWVKGEDWPVGRVVSISVDDPGVGTCSLPGQAVEGDGRFIFVMASSCDLHLGETVTVTDGFNTKSTVIEAVHFDTINEATNTAIGRATAGRAAIVYVQTDTSQASLDITIGPAGNWSADFNGLLDIHTIVYNYIRVYDPDGDALQASLVVPNFQARMTENEVHGYGWPLGATVTLTIDDPDGPDYGPVSLSPIVAPWDASQTFTQFRLGTFTLQPGQQLSMTDGNITKTHTVTDLLVSGINASLDTVSGTGTSADTIEVGPLCDLGGCALRRVVPYGGAWLADFHAAPGAPTPEEEYPYDIHAGDRSEAVQFDVDRDGTQRGWQFPPYWIFLPLVLR